MIYNTVRNLLFQLDPEVAHDFTLKNLNALYRLGLLKKSIPQLPRTVMGINFPNPVGLAAGLDKNGDYIEALAALGFGFIEIGTVTPKPQAGNPKPRIFRLPQAEAIINRMGFNSKGVEYLVGRLKKTQYRGVLGINIGKNFTTPLADAVSDYLFCMQQVYPFASYITINISSPNTPGLRDLQGSEYLQTLLTTLKTQQKEYTAEQAKYVPLLVKIAPDIELNQIRELAQTFLQYEVDGVIATNTTVSRKEVQNIAHSEEAGGLSGKPLFKKSTLIIKQLHELLGGKIPIIAAGGIMNANDALEKLQAGADLIQLYTGFIYRGPGLIKEINKRLERNTLSQE